MYIYRKLAKAEGKAEAVCEQCSLKEDPPHNCPEYCEPVKIFCFDCNHLICRDCILYDHHEHKSDFVKKCAIVGEQEISLRCKGFKTISQLKTRSWLPLMPKWTLKRRSFVRQPSNHLVS